MIGAILGDIIGSTREWHNVKKEDFELFEGESHFTDDSVLTIAVAEKLISNCNCEVNSKKAYAMWYRQYYLRYPHAGYGNMFTNWATNEFINVNKSYANGAAMRVVPIGLSFDDYKPMLKEVKDSCYYTHHHRESFKGACAVATAVFLANRQFDKDYIKKFIEKEYKYEFIPLDEIREKYEFNSASWYTVPPAIQAFFESDSYETAIRKAISIGGDSDTIACMTGGIANAYYKNIPKEILDRGNMYIDSGFKKVMKEFDEKIRINI